MNSILTTPRAGTLLIALVLVFLAGCATTPFADRYDPEKEYAALWGDEGFSVGREWKLIGTDKITVRGEAWNAIIAPVDEIQTMIFIRSAEPIPRVLLLSRVVKTGHQIVFRPLDGPGTQVDKRIFREQTYGLDSNTNNPEYRRYLDFLSKSGISIAPGYTVRILDRLPLNTVLIRAMELTPAETVDALPAYGTLYPQEIDDQLRLRDFRP